MSSKITNSGLGASEATLSLSDVTTDNVSTARHGFAPKLPNDATKYLDGTGAYTVPVGGATVLAAFNSAQFDKTNDTLADVTGLSVPLPVGTWDIRTELLIVSGAGGAQVTLSGTLTSTMLRYAVRPFDIDNGQLGALAAMSALDVPASFSAGTTYSVSISGAVTVSVAGTLKIMFAQGAADVQASSVLPGGRIIATKIG